MIEQKINDVEIDKSMFSLVDRSEESFHDTSIAGKPVGFFKDGLKRFKKNKASVVAFWIIAVIILFTLIGPVMRNHEPTNETRGVVRQGTFEFLTPRIPVLEHLGIFNGTRVIVSRNYEFISSLPEGIVIEILNKEVIQGVTLVDARVNYYRFRHYVTSHRSGIDAQGNPIIPTFNITRDQLQLALERDAVLEIVEINAAGSYVVRLDTFQFFFGTGPDDVYFWFGTGSIGEDLFTQLWSSSRISLLLAVIVSVVNISIGVIVGSTVGYFGGKLDIIFERVVEILSNIPFIVMLTLLLLAFGSNWGVIIIAFTATGWIGAYNLSRVQAYRFRAREFILAARTYGASSRRIILKHILPNGMGTLVTSFALAIPAFVFQESTMTFLGIIQYPEGIRGIGRMLSDGQNVMQMHPHLLIFPSILLALLMISFNMFSNGLRDGFNPSLRGVEE